MREGWIEYKSLAKEAKKAVSKAKFNGYDELYNKSRPRESEREIYRLVKIREKRSNYFQKVWCIKKE